MLPSLRISLDALIQSLFYDPLFTASLQNTNVTVDRLSLFFEVHMASDEKWLMNEKMRCAKF